LNIFFAAFQLQVVVSKGVTKN